MFRSAPSSTRRRRSTIRTAASTSRRSREGRRDAIGDRRRSPPTASPRREQRTASTTAAIAAQNLKALVAAGIPIATGTDAGNPLTLHGPAIYAEMEAMQTAGMTPMQVLDRPRPPSPRRAMGRDTEFGTIEKGKDADLVIVGADPSADVANVRKIRYVVRGGVVRTIDDLHALAQR